MLVSEGDETASTFLSVVRSHPRELDARQSPACASTRSSPRAGSALRNTAPIKVHPARDREQDQRERERPAKPNSVIAAALRLLRQRPRAPSGGRGPSSRRGASTRAHRRRRGGGTRDRLRQAAELLRRERRGKSAPACRTPSRSRPRGRSRARPEKLTRACPGINRSEPRALKSATGCGAAFEDAEQRRLNENATSSAYVSGSPMAAMRILRWPALVTAPKFE